MGKARQHTEWFIYILYDPTFVSTTYYVGYSYDPQHRLSGHIGRKGENDNKDEWVAELAIRGIRPIPFVVTSFSTKKQVLEAEKHLISFCRKNHISLLNKLPGGDEPPLIIGEEHCNAKLTWKTAEEIRDKYFNGKVSKQKLADEYGVSKGLIRTVVHYDGWVNENTIIPNDLEQLLKDRAEYGLEKEYSNRAGINNGRAKIDEAGVIKMRQLFDTGEYTKKQLSEMFHITHTQACNIVNGKSWQHI